MDGIVEAPHLGPDTSDADLAPLAAIIGDAPFVGLGESLHCAGGYLEAKARIVRWLVETQGFRLITIESPWVWAEGATRFVDSGEGTAREAMASFFGAFHDRETEAMLAWLRAWNVEHPDDPVHFVGFDVQDHVPDLVAKLESLGVDHDLAASCGVGPCEVTSADPWVDLVVRTLDARRELTGLHQPDQYVQYGAVRDDGMAGTLLAIREIVAPDARTVVLAHNGHLARKGSAFTYVNMGEHLDAALGTEWAPLGFVSPVVDTSCQGIARDHGRQDVEHAIERHVASPAAFVDLKQATWLEDRMWSLGGDLVRPSDQFRGLVWFDHVRGAIDTSSYAGTPAAEADALKTWGPFRIFSHDTEDSRTEQERLWSSYADWIASIGYVPKTKRHHAPWNHVTWQTFENDAGLKEYLEVRRPGKDDRWDVWLRTWEPRHTGEDAHSVR